MKKGFIIGLATGLTIASASLVLANTQIQAILNDQIKVSLNGVAQRFQDETTHEIQYPITYKDRTYLPLRTVANLVGVNVDYDSQTQTALLETNEYVENEKEYTTVRVSSINDFLNSIGPNKKIILTNNFFYTDNAKTYFSSDYASFADCFDGLELVIHDVENLQICAEDDVTPEILTTSRYANVLNFRDCKNIKIDGLMIGHDVQKGYCTGGVIKIEDSSNINISNCYLYGCGTYGIIALGTINVHVTNTDIYGCSYGLVDLSNCKEFAFDNCIFRDSQEFSMFEMNNCSNINYNNCTITNNKSTSFSSLIDITDCYDISFNKCLFENNTYTTFANRVTGLALPGCKMVNNTQY